MAEMTLDQQRAVAMARARLRLQDKATAQSMPPEARSPYEKLADIEAARLSGAPGRDYEAERLSAMKAATAETERRSALIPRSTAARAKAGFSVEPQERLAIAKTALEKHFGAAVDAGIKDGEIVFQHPETGEVLPFNPPGMDVSDLGAVPGALPELAGEAAGAFVSPFIGTAIGSIFGQMGKYGIGRAMGLNQNTEPMSALGQAQVPAVLAGAAASIPKIASGIGRFAAAAPAKSVMEASKSANTRYLDPDLREIEAVTGRKFNLTLAQTSDSPLLHSEESALARMEKGQPLRDQYDEQQAIIEQFRNSVSAPFERSQLDEIETGAAVKKVARLGPTQALERVTGETGAAQSAAVRAGAGVSQKASPPNDAAALAREALQKGRDTLQAKFSQEYEALGAENGALSVNLGSFGAAGQKWRGIVNKDLLPSLSAEDAKVFGNAADAKGPASLATVQRDLASLREELRAIKAGRSPRRDAKAVQELHDALLADRNAAIDKVPGLKDKVLAIESSYRQFKTDIDRGTIGSVLETRKNAGWAIRDERVIPQILASPSGMKSLVTALKDPKYGTFGGGLEAIKKGVLGEYESRVLDPTTKIADVGRHATFMRQNNASLSMLFDKQEMAALKTPGAASRMLQDKIRREAGVTAQLNKSFNLKLDGLDESAIVDSVVKPGNLGDTRRLMKILEAHPPTREAVQAKVTQRLWRDVSTYDRKTGRPELDPAKLSAAASDQKTMQMLKITHGPEFTRNVGVISRVMSAVDRSPTRLQEDKNVLISVFRVVARPLSREGLVVTAARAFRKEAADRVMVNAFSDPSEMARLVQLWNAKPSKAASILSLWGADALMEDSE
mgnify:CR=1 FL=1